MQARRLAAQMGPGKSTAPACARSSPPPGAGPRGRRGDQVGGFTLMHREDLRRVAPHWLKFTEAVRFDPDVSLSGGRVGRGVGVLAHRACLQGTKPGVAGMHAQVAGHEGSRRPCLHASTVSACGGKHGAWSWQALCLTGAAYRGWGCRRGS